MLIVCTLTICGRKAVFFNHWSGHMWWNTSVANPVCCLLNTLLLGAVQFELWTLLFNNKWASCWYISEELRLTSCVWKTVTSFLSVWSSKRQDFIKQVECVVEAYMKHIWRWSAIYLSNTVSQNLSNSFIFFLWLLIFYSLKEADGSSHSTYIREDSWYHT